MCTCPAPARRPRVRRAARAPAARHPSWRAYIDGIDEGAGSPAACAHPLAARSDPTALSSPAGEAYATFRDPFVYLCSITASASCAREIVGMRQLVSDLARGRAAPSFAYIAPDRCHDGEPVPCAPGAPAGLAPADAFLQRVVSQILSSRAYREAGLLVITVDQAPLERRTGGFELVLRPAALPQPGAGGASGAAAGRGQVGALLLSPFIKGAATSQEPYNHFSLLRTIEDVFHLGHIGYAAAGKVSSFQASLFSAYRPR